MRRSDERRTQADTSHTGPGVEVPSDDGNNQFLKSTSTLSRVDIDDITPPPRYRLNPGDVSMRANGEYRWAAMKSAARIHPKYLSRFETTAFAAVLRQSAQLFTPP